MGRLQLVGSLKLQVSFAENRLFYRALLQKRPIILRSLLIVATPYSFKRISQQSVLSVCACFSMWHHTAPSASMRVTRRMAGPNVWKHICIYLYICIHIAYIYFGIYIQSHGGRGRGVISHWTALKIYLYLLTYLYWNSIIILLHLYILTWRYRALCDVTLDNRHKH